MKEINLIAQDLAAFGREKGSDDLLPLLKELCKIEGIEWIRLLYMYPENISQEFIDFLKHEPKLAKYLDIPVQHASDRILKSMKRDVDHDFLTKLFKSLRTQIPELVIRTSVMVGFPGETQEDFEQLRDFVSRVEFDHLGCFSYSKEEGTVAGRMEDQVDEEIKKQRQAEIMELQQSISQKRLARHVGQTIPVLVEGVSEESDLLFQGRAIWQAPEVDGLVYINDGNFKKGEIQNVLIEQTHHYDLVGNVVH